MAPGVTLENTVGALYVSSALAALLFGVSSLQSYIYYHDYRRDWYITKISVAILWMLEGLHLGLTIRTIYFYIVESFGALSSLRETTTTLLLSITFTTIIILGIQTLYGLRIWRLSQNFENQVVFWIVIVFLVAGYGVGILLVIKIYNIEVVSDIFRMKWLIYACLGSILLKDILISASMCFYLSKTRTGFLKTNHTVDRLIRFSVASGLITCAGSSVAIITFYTMPDTSVFISTLFILTQLYLNSFLAMLNSRKSIRDSVSLNQDAGLLSSDKPPMRQNSKSSKDTRIRFQTSKVVSRDPLPPTVFDICPLKPQPYAFRYSLTPKVPTPIKTKRGSFQPLPRMSFGGTMIAASPTASEHSKHLGLTLWDDTASSIVRVTRNTRWP